MALMLELGLYSANAVLQEWRRMHYNFYPCIRADSLTRLMIRYAHILVRHNKRVPT